MAVIALDLGGTKLAGAIFQNKKPFGRTVTPLDYRTGKQVGRLITDQIVHFLTMAKVEGISIEAIGISVPGIARQKNGTVWAPNIPGWENYPLRREIERVVGQKISIQIDSDRACYILGEVWQGAAKNCENAVFIAVGTGIGAGVLIDGKVLRGADDIAGAIGWLALDRPFREEYVFCGCFEHHASGEGIAKIAREIAQAEKNYKGLLRGKRDLAARDVFEAYKSGDFVAVKTFQQAIEFWGMAAANLVSIFNPEKIIFGGGVFGPATQFLKAISAEAKKWAQPIAIKQVTFEASKLGSDAGLYGAAYLVLSK